MPPLDATGTVEELTPEDIHAFAESLYQRAFLEALMHGNITVEDVVSVARNMSDSSNIEPVAREDTSSKPI